MTPRASSSTPTRSPPTAPSPSTSTPSPSPAVISPTPSALQAPIGSPLRHFDGFFHSIPILPPKVPSYSRLALFSLIHFLFTLFALLFLLCSFLTSNVTFFFLLLFIVYYF